MAPPLLLLQDIRLTLGGAPLLDGAGFGVSPGERLCLVGRNGSGKSTLLRIAAGELLPDSGTRFLQPGTTLRTLPQEPDLSSHATTLDAGRRWRVPWPLPRTCCCWTSRPTTSTCRPSSGWNVSCCRRPQPW